MATVQVGGPSILGNIGGGIDFTPLGEAFRQNRLDKQDLGFAQSKQDILQAAEGRAVEQEARKVQEFQRQQKQFATQLQDEQDKREVLQELRSDIEEQTYVAPILAAVKSTDSIEKVRSVMQAQITRANNDKKPEIAKQIFELMNGTEEQIRSNINAIPGERKALREEAAILGINVPGLTGRTAEEKTFNALIKDLSPEDQKKAKLVKAGLRPKALTDQIVDVGGVPHSFNRNTGQLEPVKIKGKEVTTQTVADSKAKIKADVKLAEKKAIAEGETFTATAKARAALPGIEEVVGKLRVLADQATFTLSGKAFNEVAKQFGFATKGDTARASMIALIDNQVLPLLKPIFGAAFTEREGESLKKSMADPNSTPESRQAQLDAFLGQMRRNIETSERELDILGADQPGAQAQPEAQQETGITAEQFRSMTPEQRAAALQQLQVR